LFKALCSGVQAEMLNTANTVSSCFVIRLPP
jgi:hypothetical protein